MFLLSVSPEKAPDEAQYVEIDYEKGDPVAVDGERLSPASLLAKLNEIGGKHGVGRADIVENRYVGPSRAACARRRAGRSHGGAPCRGVLTLDREVEHLRDSLIPRYAEMVYLHYWFAPSARCCRRRSTRRSRT